MSVTQEKENDSKNIADIMSTPRNNAPPLIKYHLFLKNGTKPHYEGSESTETDSYRVDKYTENT